MQEGGGVESVGVSVQRLHKFFVGLVGAGLIVSLVILVIILLKSVFGMS